MLLDLIALIVLGLFVLWGFIRGSLAAGLSFLTLIVSYFSAIWGGPFLAPLAGQYLPAYPFLAVPLGCATAFVISFLVLGFVTFLLCRAERIYRRDNPRSAIDRLGGAMFGTFRALLFIFLLGILGHYLHQAQRAGIAESLPKVEGSIVAKIAGFVVEKALARYLDESDPGTKLIARLAFYPGTTMEGINDVAASPQFKGLITDKVFWQYLEDNKIEDAMERESMLSLSQDSEVRNQLADLGVVDGNLSPKEFRDEIHNTLEKINPALQNLRQDHHVQELLSQDEIVRMARTGDIKGLLSNQDFQEAVQAILNGIRKESLSYDPAADTDIDTDSDAGTAETDDAIYKYVDDSGRVHFVSGLKSIPEEYRSEAEKLSN